MNINIRGHKFSIENKSSSWVWNTLESWDPYTFNWLDKNKGKNIFWDVGAWIGPFSIYGSKLFKKVISFEPDPIAANVLLDHIVDNNIPNILLSRKGLYNKNTTLDFGFIGGKFGDSLSSINHTDSKTIKIETISIDNAINLYGIPDFLKIDIEGGEEYLIDDLAKHKFKKFCMANHGEYMKNRKIFSEKLNELLLPLYNCYDPQNNKLDKIPDDGDFYYELKIN